MMLSSARHDSFSASFGSYDSVPGFFRHSSVVYFVLFVVTSTALLTATAIQVQVHIMRGSTSREDIDLAIPIEIVAPDVFTGHGKIQ